MPKSIKFTEAELETIERAMDDYMCYHDDDTPASDLIGGLPVSERVNDIMSKITEAYVDLSVSYTHLTLPTNACV